MLTLLSKKQTKTIPPMNWQWVKEGGEYIRQEAWPHSPIVSSARNRHVELQPFNMTIWSAAGSQVTGKGQAGDQACT